MKALKLSTASAPKSKKSKSTRPKKSNRKNESTKKGKRIPSPPSQDASWEEQSGYLDKYTFVEREKAGYLKPVKDDKFVDELARSATVQKTREQVNISLEPDQFVQLKKIAKLRHLTPATLARAWLLDRLTDELTNSN
jgi:hypothetical protein